MRTKIIILFLIGIISISAIIYSSSCQGLREEVTTYSSHSKSYEYIIKNYSITFKVPDSTEVQVDTDIEGNEIFFSIYFTNNELAYRGYIQLWKIENLKEFLDNSKYLSPFNFIFYKINNIKLNSYKGYIIEWTTEYEQHIKSGNEYWLKINDSNEVVRISFITDKEKFPTDLKDIINQLLKSLQIEANNE